MKRRLPSAIGAAAALATLAISAPAAAQAEPGARAETPTGQNAAPPSPLDPWQAPVLTSTRFDEHWDALADPTLRDDHWTGRFKYIPVASDAYLTTGLELRARYENYHGNGWGSAQAPDDAYLWFRALPYADLHVGSGPVGVRAFVQPIATYAIGVAPAPSGVDQSRLDMLQAFADVRLGSATGSASGFGATLRYGRQMISLGSERLVGTRYGINVPLAYDGVRGLASLSGATVTLFAIRPVTPGTASFDDRATRGRRLRGVYATVPTLLGTGIDLYFLLYHNGAARFGGVDGHEVRRTFGLRLFGARPNSWHWDVETIAQSGRFAGARIGAWAFGAEFGRRLASAATSPDLTLRFDVVSGDHRPGDGKLGTFDPLFPKGKYFGELSPVGPVNIINIDPRLTIPVTPVVSLGLMANAYWRTSTADGIYGVPGNLVRAPGGANARYVGEQVEGVASWQATPELTLSASLSAFAPGAFIRQTGPARTITLVGSEANFRF